MTPSEILLTILGLVVLSRFLPAIVAPIRVRRNNSLSPDPAFEPCDGERLPRDMVRLIAALGELGFVVRGTWRNLGHSIATGQITVLEHPGTLDVAKVMIAASGGRRQVALLFQTQFEDGEEIATANNQITVGLPSLPKTTVVWLPEVRDALQLYRVHEEVRDGLGRGRRRRPIGPDPTAFLCEGRDRIVAHHVQTGYYFLDEARGTYRPTWKGAILMTWRLMWPIRPLYRAWRRRRTNKLLDELGIYPEPD